MADVINFKCGACGKAFSVKPEYAGRKFACKDCGTRLCVPQAGQDGFHVDAQVEMDSGAEVMRKTTPSGRQVPADPTRVFKKHRETSGRVAAVPQPVAVSPESKSSKLPLVIIALLLLIGGGGVGAAFALGVFEPEEAKTERSAAANRPEGNEPEPEGPDDSVRTEIFKELETLGSDSQKLAGLFERAEKAGLRVIDLGTIGRKVVSAMMIDQGGALTDAQMIQFAGRLNEIDQPGEAIEVYKVIINRHRGSTNPPEEVAEAHRALGRHHIDFTPAITRASDLRDYGIHDDVGGLYDELIEMDARSDNGWVPPADKQRHEAIVARLDEADNEIEALKTEDPFVLEAALVRRRFAGEPLSRHGEWVDFVVEPFIVFVQKQNSRETTESVEQRIKPALERLAPFAAFFKETFIRPMGLERTMPAAVDPHERDGAPFEILLFRGFSHWQNYLNDYSAESLKAHEVSYFMEPGTGRASTVFREEGDTRPQSNTRDITQFRWLMAEQQLFCHHPRAPKTKSEHEGFDTLTAYVLSAYFRVATTREVVTPGIERATYQFFVDDGNPANRLMRFNRPMDIANARDPGLGGPAFTVADLVKASSLTEVERINRERLSSYDGWDEESLDKLLTSANTRAIFAIYLRGFYDFIWNYSGEGETPKYREKFREFLLKDMQGEVDKEDPSPVFAESFGLGEDWSEIEGDWLEYQTPG